MKIITWALILGLVGPTLSDATLLFVLFNRLRLGGFGPVGSAQNP